MTIWLHRINIIAPQADTAALNAIWTIIAPEGDSEAQTFGVPLSATGNEPATHRGISTAATAIMQAMITDTFAAELANCQISIQDYRLNDWAEFLDLNGLQTIEPELIDG